MPALLGLPLSWKRVEEREAAVALVDSAAIHVIVSMWEQRGGADSELVRACRGARMCLGRHGYHILAPEGHACPTLCVYRKVFEFLRAHHLHLKV